LQSKTQKLEKEKAIAMFDNLKQQLNPHFLFNSLSSLSGLIEWDAQVASKFLNQLSVIYRYILKNAENETVLLQDEILFATMYVDLQKTRFNEGLVVNVDVAEEFYDKLIAPVTVQNMIENAIKHNIIDKKRPLVIDIFVDDNEYLVIRNNLQKKSVVETSNQKGLQQFISLYQYMTSKPVIIESQNPTHFIIKIPLI
jgi:LytS/YehU family sensor histidine kinase